MGFRTKAFAKVWKIDQRSDAWTKVQLSISKKNKDTGDYETEFSGFVSFLGTAVASKAARLQKGDTIRLGDVDVTNKYDKEKEVTYTNFNCYGFQTREEFDGDSASPAPITSYSDPTPENVDDGNIGDSDLPF